MCGVRRSVRHWLRTGRPEPQATRTERIVAESSLTNRTAGATLGGKNGTGPRLDGTSHTEQTPRVSETRSRSSTQRSRDPGRPVDGEAPNRGLSRVMASNGGPSTSRPTCGSWPPEAHRRVEVRWRDGRASGGRDCGVVDPAIGPVLAWFLGPDDGMAGGIGVAVCMPVLG